MDANNLNKVLIMIQAAEPDMFDMNYFNCCITGFTKRLMSPEDHRFVTDHQAADFLGLTMGQYIELERWRSLYDPEQGPFEPGGMHDTCPSKAQALEHLQNMITLGKYVTWAETLGVSVDYPSD